MVLTPVVGIPVACVVAVLKYRLYDIDRLISRTVSYAVVTGRCSPRTFRSGSRADQGLELLRVAVGGRDRSDSHRFRSDRDEGQ